MLKRIITIILCRYWGHLEPPFCCCWHSHFGCCPIPHRQVQAAALHCNPTGMIHENTHKEGRDTLKSDESQTVCYLLTCLVNSKGFRQKTYNRAAASIPDSPPHTVATVNSPVYMCRDSAKLTNTSVLHPAIRSCSVISDKTENGERRLCCRRHPAGLKPLTDVSFGLKFLARVWF